MTSRGLLDPAPSAPLREKGPGATGARLGVLALGVATAVSCTRFFTEWGPVWLLVVVAAASWATAEVMRMLWPSPSVGEALHLVLGVVAVVAIAGRAESWNGVPVPRSLVYVVQTVRDDLADFNDLVAPVEARTGHLVMLAVLLWVLGLFASSATMRLRSPVQGAIPHTVSLVALGLLARDHGRGIAAVCLLVGVSLHALAQANWRTVSLRWVPRPREARRRPLVVGAAMLALAAVAGLATAPLLPGGSSPVLDLRRGGLGDEPRSVVSPFVDVGSNLQQRSQQLLFTVTAAEPGYWRLTALDTFDAEAGIWVLSNSYSPVDGDLGARPPDGPVAEVAISGLGGFWVPTIPAVAAADSRMDLGWDPSSRSLISRGSDLAAGDVVAQRSSEPLGGGATLEAVAVAGAGDPDTGGLLDTAGLPPELAEQARVLAGDAEGFEAALALQRWFRDEFTYDETVDLSGSPDPLAEFLDIRRGFCQQFSTAFALAARSLGLPSRVVVGFTPGDPTSVATDPGGTQRTTFAVRGRHAHAWPEVFLEGVGWVPFEPTPGRGDPSSAELLGVAPEQAAPDPAAPPEPVETTTTAPPPPQAPGADGAPSPDELVAGAAPQDEPSPGAPSTPWVVVFAAVLVAVVVAALVLRRSRRTGAGRGDTHDPARARVQSVWAATVAELGRHGLSPSADETPVEFARRAGATRELPGLPELAEAESRRRWSSAGLDDRDVAFAEVAATRVRDALGGPAPEPVAAGRPPG